MQWFDPRMAGWYCKESVPQDERVEGGNGSIPEWREGIEKGWSLGGKKEESREKREERREKRENGRQLDLLHFYRVP